MPRFEPISRGIFDADEPARDIREGDEMFEVYDTVRGRPYSEGLTEGEADETAEGLNRHWSGVARERTAAAHNARLHRGGR